MADGASWRSRAGRAAGPLVGLVLLAVVVWRHDPEEIGRQMERGRPLAMVPFAFAMPITYLLLQAAWDGWVLRRVLGGPRYVDLVRGKAGTAVLTAIGYLLGTGGYAVWIARRTRSRPSLVAGLITYLTASDVAGIALAALAATALWDREGVEAVRFTTIAVVGTAAAAIVLLPRLPRVGPLASAAFDPWRAVPVHVGLLQMAGRAVTMATCGSILWLGARAFCLDLPAHVAAAYIPVLMLLASLPVNVAGFGAAQAGWVFAFEPWVPSAQILAFHLLWQLALNVAIVLRGLPFLPRTLADIARADDP